MCFRNETLHCKIGMYFSAKVYQVMNEHMNIKYATTFWFSNTKSSFKYSNSDGNSHRMWSPSLKGISEHSKVPELNIINKCWISYSYTCTWLAACLLLKDVDSVHHVAMTGYGPGWVWTKSNNWWLKWFLVHHCWVLVTLLSRDTMCTFQLGYTTHHMLVILTATVTVSMVETW